MFTASCFTRFQLVRVKLAEESRTKTKSKLRASREQGARVVAG